MGGIIGGELCEKPRTDGHTYANERSACWSAVQ